MSIQLLGQKEASRMLMTLSSGVKDARPFFAGLERDLHQAKDKQFSSQGSYLTKRWARLSPSTLKYKRGSSILKETGNLKSSFATKRVTNSEMVYGSSSSYYKYHQLGTRKMPQRQILGFSSALEQIIKSKWDKYITNLTR